MCMRCSVGVRARVGVAWLSCVSQQLGRVPNWPRIFVSRMRCVYSDATQPCSHPPFSYWCDHAWRCETVRGDAQRGNPTHAIHDTRMWRAYRHCNHNLFGRPLHGRTHVRATSATLLVTVEFVVNRRSSLGVKPIALQSSHAARWTVSCQPILTTRDICIPVPLYSAQPAWSACSTLLLVGPCGVLLRD